MHLIILIGFCSRHVSPLDQKPASGIRPKIYIYDLPQYKDSKKFGHEFTPGCFYTLDVLFPQLLRESPYWTNNTEEADYFYVRSSFGD